MIPCNGSKRLAKITLIEYKLRPLCPVCGKLLGWEDFESRQTPVVPEHEDEGEMAFDYPFRGPPHLP